jgi:eukaryotic-like serine/threonine-protein kinase
LGKLATSAAPGKVVGGRYELIEPAGRGGMATVWRAQLRGAGGFARTVAIKQMHEHLQDNRVYVDMFFEEARVGAALHSPNIPQVYDCIEEDDRLYLVMEWVEGIDLGTLVHYFRDRGQRTRWDLVAAIGVGMLRALAAAHERRTDDGELAPIVHRDVSPHNVLLSIRGQVKLIDFGLSLARDRRGELTEPGVVKGKMAYLSPGVVSGRRPSPFSDQFAAATVLWESLVGRQLFAGANDFEVYKKMRDAQIEPLRPQRPDIPKALATIIQKALSPAEQDRYPSAREMAAQLSHVLKARRARRDLHQQLAETVTRIRSELHLGHRTRDSEGDTPVAELAVGERIPVEEAGAGLRHWLPFFRRRP